ncbi:hypothetical protein CLQ43_27400 (plasmid) [Klebsiella pneumoniae]|nr:hypothetical protein F3Y39_27835 [Klebsiella pneumoniae]MBD7482574.1 hypothetical protein [Klebsiella pneumoniae]PBA93506.1 hypothetical protein CK495_29010 [Klebsiella pneumoniae]QBP84681.1 hypothetical protein CLQ43_27400 [Klebsiella pneumoniae]
MREILISESAWEEMTCLFAPSLTLMHEWSKLKKENADLYDYNGQVNRGWRGFILRMMGIHLPDNDRVRLQGINARKDSIYPE